MFRLMKNSNFALELAPMHLENSIITGIEDAANELRKMQTLEGARKEMGLSDNDDKPLKQNMFKVV